MPWRTLKHFKLSITGKPSQLFDETNIDWAPSQNLGYKEVTKVTMDRYDRAVWRERNKRRRIEAEVCETMTATATATARATQTVLTGIEVDSLVNSTKEVEELRQRCVQLEQDNSALRAEKKELSEKITALNEAFLKMMTKR